VIDPIGATLGLPAHHDIAASVQRIATIDPHSAGQDPLQDSERRKYVRHVVVDRDAVALAAQRIATLVHADAPAALGQTNCGHQAAETSPDDLRMAGPHYFFPGFWLGSGRSPMRI
jgi:hypothetical protein